MEVQSHCITICLQDTAPRELNNFKYFVSIIGKTLILLRELRSKLVEMKRSFQGTLWEEDGDGKTLR